MVTDRDGAHGGAGDLRCGTEEHFVVEMDFPRNGKSLQVVDRPPACESEVLGGGKGVAKATVSRVDGSMVPLWVNRIAEDL